MYVVTYVVMLYVCTYIPPELVSKHSLAKLLHNHHNSNDVPKVYIPSTMIETCTILQYSSSENKMHIYVRM